MCDRKQNCDEKRDHKDQGMGQEFGDLNKFLNKDDNKQKGVGELRGDIQGIHKDDQCKSGQKCGDKDDKEKKLYGEQGCGNKNQDQCH